MSVRSGPRGVGKGGSRTTYDDIVQKQATQIGTVSEAPKAPTKAPTKKPLSVNTLMGQAHSDTTNVVQFAEGFKNQALDYQGIVDGEYKHKAIANIAMERAFAGDWAGAGQIIQENPARFAGNIAFEAATAAIPVGTALKAAKVTQFTKKLTHPATEVVRTAMSKTIGTVGGGAMYAADVIGTRLPFLKPAFAQGIDVTPESLVTDTAIASQKKAIQQNVMTQDAELKRVADELRELDKAPPEYQGALQGQRDELLEEAKGILGISDDKLAGRHSLSDPNPFPNPVGEAGQQALRAEREMSPAYQNAQDFMATIREQSSPIMASPNKAATSMFDQILANKDIKYLGTMLGSREIPPKIKSFAELQAKQAGYTFTDPKKVFTDRQISQIAWERFYKGTSDRGPTGSYFKSAGWTDDLGPGGTAWSEGTYFRSQIGEGNPYVAQLARGEIGKFDFYKKMATGAGYSSEEPFAFATAGEMFRFAGQKLKGRFNLGRQKGDKALEQEWGMKLFRGGSDYSDIQMGQMLSRPKPDYAEFGFVAASGPDAPFANRAFINLSAEGAFVKDDTINAIANHMIDTISHETTVHNILGNVIGKNIGRSSDIILYNDPAKRASMSVTKGSPDLPYGTGFSEGGGIRGGTNLLVDNEGYTFNPMGYHGLKGIDVIGAELVEKSGKREGMKLSRATFQENRLARYFDQKYSLEENRPKDIDALSMFERQWDSGMPMGGDIQQMKRIKTVTASDAKSWNKADKEVGGLSYGKTVDFSEGDWFSRYASSDAWSLMMKRTKAGSPNQNQRLSAYKSAMENMLRAAKDPVFKKKYTKEIAGKRFGRKKSMQEAERYVDRGIADVHLAYGVPTPAYAKSQGLTAKEIQSLTARLPDKVKTKITKKARRVFDSERKTMLEPPYPTIGLTDQPSPLLRQFLEKDEVMYKYAKKQYKKQKGKEVAMRGMVIGGGLLGSKSMLAGSMGVIGAHNKQKQKQKFEDVWWRDNKAWNESFKTQPWR